MIERDGNHVYCKFLLGPATKLLSLALVFASLIGYGLYLDSDNSALYPLVPLAALLVLVSLASLLPRLRKISFTTKGIVKHRIGKDWLIPWQDISGFTVSAHNYYDTQFYVKVHTEQGIVLSLPPLKDSTAFETAHLLRQLHLDILHEPLSRASDIETILKDEHHFMQQQLNRAQHHLTMMPAVPFYSIRTVILGILIITFSTVSMLNHWQDTPDLTLILDAFTFTFGICVMSYRRMLFYNAQSRRLFTGNRILMFDSSFALIGDNLSHVELFRGLWHQTSEQRHSPYQRYWSFSLVNDDDIDVFFRRYDNARSAKAISKTIATRFNLPLEIIDEPDPTDWYGLVVHWLMIVVSLILLAAIAYSIHSGAGIIEETFFWMTKLLQ